MTRPFIYIFGLIMALSFFGESAQAQTEEDALRFTQRFPATGARMIGMGGAGVAGVADFSAMFYNPAGMGFLERSIATGSLSMLSTRNDAMYRTPTLSTSLDSDTRETGIENLAYIYRAPTIRGSLVFGVSFNQVYSFERNLQFRAENTTSSITDHFLPFDDEYGVGEDEVGFFPRFFANIPEIAYRGGAIEFLFEEVEEGRFPFYQAVTPGTRIEQRGEVIDAGRMSELNVGGAWEAAPGIMVGTSANFVFGQYRYNKFYREIDAFGENQPEWYVVILDDGREFRGFDEVRVDERFRSDLFGFNLRAGISGNATEYVRVGATLETPTFYTVNEDFSTEVQTFFQEGGSLQYGGQTGDVGTGVFEYRMRSPWRLSGGVAFEQDNFTVSGDVEWVDWSQLRMTASESQGYFDDVNRRIENNMDMVFNTRLGGEYRLDDLALRAGFAYYPDPRIHEAGFEAPDRSRMFYSAGVGYRFGEQLRLDFGWMQERFEDQFLPYTRVDNPPAVDESISRNRFSLGVTFSF